MSTQLEKLKQEEAELEAQMLGNQTPEDPGTVESPGDPEISATEDDGIEQTPEELEAAEFMEQTIVTPSHPEDLGDPIDPEEPQPQKPKRTNWKKRFTNYKTSTDATVYGLRKELMDINANISDLMLENQRLREAKREEQGDMFEGAFSQEEEDTFGTEGLDVVKKAAKVAIERQVKPLREELRKHEEARAKDIRTRADSDRRNAYQGFLSRLESLIPDYAELNVDKSFIGWLKEADDFSGQTRGDLFRRAENTGDVARVADFFMDFKRSRTAIAEASQVPEQVRRHMTPTGTGGAGAPKRKDPDKGYYRQSDIDKFYSDVMKGRYADQRDVILATEQAIEEAATDGRVLMNQ